LNRVLACALLALAALGALAACSGIAKGVTQAVLDRKEQSAQPEMCEIRGRPLTGVADSLDAQARAPGKVTKVLMVHGISRHTPGYSARLQANMALALGMNATSEGYKEIHLRRSDFTDDRGEMTPLGVLRVTRHANLEDGREMLFYELTWSEVTEGARAALSFDEGLGYRRADVNRMIKSFFNATVSDLMVYRGYGQPKITGAVGQAVCWTFLGGWDDLPGDGGAHVCTYGGPRMLEAVARDDYFFVSHSLGSRIVVDTLAMAVTRSQEARATHDPKAGAVFDLLRHKDITVYMLSNQLPLLQLGIAQEGVFGAEGRYCGPGAARPDERVFQRLDLVAFSDPNDVLSYSLPPGYAQRYIDSRLCAQVVNVDLNVTPVQSAFGVGFANPAAAHGGYQSSGRVADLIAHGVGPGPSDVPAGCRWTRVVE
jgi:hypothetical protein